MKLNRRSHLRILRGLYRLNKDSERGFESVAEHVKNRGMKALLKSQAQRRAEFAADLRSEIHQLQGALPTGGSLLAALHRGLIDIKAAMTIGRANVERVVLSECDRGESVALKRYQQALQHDLSPQLRYLLKRQAETIGETRSLVRQLAGDKGGQLVVQLFENSGVAQNAASLLQSTGIAAEDIRVRYVLQMAREYRCDCRQSRIMETGITGLILGLVFGAILGLLAGSNTVLEPLFANSGGSIMWETIVATTLVGLGAGALFGALMGSFIGQATVEEDEYVYRQSLHQGNVLVLVKADRKRAQGVLQAMSAAQLSAAAGPL